MSRKPLEGKVALVTGSTRGIGKGIALQLAEAGALVYITGRTLTSSNNSGSLEETANEIRERGGKCIPVQVDHEKDEQIASLFQKIENEQNGQLDILVNNAYKGVNIIFESEKLKFWEMKPEVWDDINNVGLRNHYFCTVYAARLMVERKQGLIINISSFGGARYLFNVPYGIGKAAVDRMAQDCGIELKSKNVVMLSLYPGAVLTELVEKNLFSDTTSNSKKRLLFDKGESTEFSGRIIVKMAQDPNIKKYSSRVVIGAEYAQLHNIKDIDNRVIFSIRELRYILSKTLPESLQFTVNYLPGFLRVPQFALDILNSKF